MKAKFLLTDLKIVDEQKGSSETPSTLDIQLTSDNMSMDKFVSKVLNEAQSTITTTKIKTSTKTPEAEMNVALGCGSSIVNSHLLFVSLLVMHFAFK